MKVCFNILRLLGFASVLILLSNCANPSGKGSSSYKDNWTILIYMAADNNLESYGSENFLQLQKANYLSNNRINVIVLFDNTSNTTLYQITHSTGSSISSKKLTSSELGITASSTSNKVDMGNTETLKNFIIYGVNQFPANHYYLQIWDHGSGWRSLGGTGSNKLRLTSKTRVLCESDHYTDTDNIYSEDVLYTKEMETAFTEAYASTKKKLDVVGFDTCYTGMLEVAYGLRNYANFMIASEETTLADGWNYQTWLENLAQKGSSSTASDIVDSALSAYEKVYSDYSGPTLAAYNLSLVDSTVTKLQTFSDVLVSDMKTDSSYSTQARKLLFSSDSFTEGSAGYDINIDLYNMVQQFAEDNTSGISWNCTSAANDLMQTIWNGSKGSSSLVYNFWNSSGNNNTGYSNHANAKGIAIHLCQIKSVTSSNSFSYTEDLAYFADSSNSSLATAVNSNLLTGKSVEIPSFVSESYNDWVPSVTYSSSTLTVSSTEADTSNGGLLGYALYNGLSSLTYTYP